MKTAVVLIQEIARPDSWEPLHSILASFSDDQIIVCPTHIELATTISRRDIEHTNELCALKEALVWAQGEPLLLAACDLTSPSAELARYMDYVRAGYDAVIPMIDEETAEPLFGLYMSECMNVLNSALISGQQFTIADILPQLTVRYIERQEIMKFGEPEIILARNR